MQRKKDDEKELLSDFDAESAVVSQVTSSPDVVKVDLDFAASTKHYGKENPPPSPPKADEDGLNAPAIQLMMENSGHTLVTSDDSSSSLSVHSSISS